jgi:hypothetical protein
MIAARVAFVAALVIPHHADADPCGDPSFDPAATPLRDAGLDGQRSACLRDELAARLTTTALIDTASFHGVLGGDLTLAGRFVPTPRLELGARARVIDYRFVQTAVTKVTEARHGPVVVTAALGGRLDERARIAAVITLELPHTRDTETLHTGGELAVTTTGALGDRWMVHGRLGAVGALASSLGGTTRRLGLRGGLDLAARAQRRIVVFGGAESQAGWHGGLDAVLARAGVHVRAGRAWRGLVGVGVPLAGNDRTTTVVQLGIAHDL